MGMMLGYPTHSATSTPEMETCHLHLNNMAASFCMAASFVTKLECTYHKKANKMLDGKHEK